VVVSSEYQDVKLLRGLILSKSKHDRPPSV